MAFGIKRKELEQWKRECSDGKIAILTHYWQDPRFPGSTSVTKVACNDVQKLIEWGASYGLKKEWIDYKESYPHFDLFGDIQHRVLVAEGKEEQLIRFKL